MSKQFFVAAALTALLGLTLPAHANLIQNGGFETPAINPGSYYNVGGLGADHPIPPGFAWSVTTNNVDLVSYGFAGSTATYVDGNQGLDLVGYGSTGGISQTFSTIAGRTYTLAFSYANNPFGGPAFAQAAVVFGGVSSLVGHSSSSDANFDWKSFSQSFVAGATGPSTLSFTETIGGGNAGIMLDAVSVTSGVPELATWAMMIIGFGGVALQLRRRRATIVLTA